MTLPFAEVMDVCDAAGLAEGKSLRFSIERPGRWALPCFAVRKKGKIYGFVNRCAHWPVTLDMETNDFWDVDERYLQCRTHGALYELSGLCIAGPCTGDGLLSLPLEERNGRIVLDRSRLSPAVLAE